MVASTRDIRDFSGNNTGRNLSRSLMLIKQLRVSLLNPGFMHSSLVSVNILYLNQLRPYRPSGQPIAWTYTTRARFAVSYPGSILLTSMKLGVGLLTGANIRPTIEHGKDPLNLYSAMSSTRADFSSNYGRIATLTGAQVPDAMPSR